MFEQFLKRRKLNALLGKTKSAAMRRFLQTASPDKFHPAHEAQYLALDLEMSGLNATQDKILSIGFVPIINQEIILREAQHIVIQHHDIDLNLTAPIHKLHHSDLKNGVSLEQGFNEVLNALAGRVLVLHHAPLDTSFLNRASQKLYGVNLHCKTVDTLQLEHQRLTRQGKAAVNRLKLADCRQRYGLPQYNAHNAAIDAIATAELWLAQLAQHPPRSNVKLNYFL